MKRFLGFVKKEFYHIFRDKRSMFILFGMPVIQIMLFGFAITNEINNVNIAILDKSNDVETKQLISKIDASRYFNIEQKLQSDTEIESVFKRGKIKLVLVFEKDFGQKLANQDQPEIQIISDATDPNVANTATNYANAIIQNYVREESDGQTKPSGIVLDSRFLYNPDMRSVYTFVPGVMTVILMLVSAMMTSISIAREKEIGTMEVLLVSPLHPFQVILGKVFPYVFLSVINAIVIVSLGVFVFGMPVKGSLLLLAAESILFIVTALSLGILISTIAQSQQTAMLISMMGLMLPVIILSGFIFPIASMPLPMQIMSNIIPAKWFIIIIKAIMLKGASFAIIWKETLILFGMTSFFILLSVKKYKIRLE
ncbi:multidrug ABC transporter permease [Flavobacterium sediminis]|uniref:Transport permease protein n=1 Tax=Flavobacterium sediminis TaxID=2201181 RepID=A0A2U8QSS5_9FLAO|nr:ABC transporter permease [Flavobacterium sediminis]AWM12936.1 multidrug ABC transporter permease [Flavobacterium sediminis]